MPTASVHPREARSRPGGVPGFFLVGGLAFAGGGSFLMLGGSDRVRGPGVTFLLIGMIWVVVAVAVRRFHAGLRRRAEEERALFETGTRAEAVVEAVRATGTVLNHLNHQVVLRLRVRPAEGAEYVAERRLFVPAYGMPRPGDRVGVAYDPADPARLALESDWRSDTGGGRLLLLRRGGEDAAGGAAAPGERVIAQLERLERLRQAGTLTWAEFEAQKARILAEG